MSEKARILIVEDNKDHLELFIDALMPQYEVVVADTKESCLKLIDEKECDIIILDYYLSNHFSGLDILREISKINKSLPVIMVTAYGNEEIAVEAIKSGAKDYIRKTLDNSYIERIVQNIEDTLSSVRARNSHNVRQEVLSFFQENRAKFIEAWLERIAFLQVRVGIKQAFAPDGGQMDRLFSAFLADIQNEQATETLMFLKKMVLLQDAEEKSLLGAELLNVAFKEVARAMLRERYPESFDSRALVMHHISAIVDENDLELSREYEKLIWEIMERMRRSERLSTKSLLITTLQHRIRQPLAFIYNTAEMILRDHTSNDEEAIKSIAEPAQRIEELLNRLEKDSHMQGMRYADNVDIIDLPENGAQ